MADLELNKNENIIIDNNSSIERETSSSPKETENKNDIICPELKNIEYQTMLMKGIELKVNHSAAIYKPDELDSFLENKKKTIKKISWSKLDKTQKIRKLNDFIERYSIENELSIQDKEEMKKFIKVSLNRKKLQRVKDVSYDKDKGIINSIPLLVFNKETHKFTLKSSKKKSTSSSLGLGNKLKNKNKTTKNNKNKNKN